MLNEKYVVVHLTWIGKTEQLGFPGVELYDSFDDFKRNRMHPDKMEWESLMAQFDNA